MLGPLLYVLHTAELGRIVELHRIQLRQYADDSQVYMSITVGNTIAAVQKFTVCIADMNAWMSASRLQLNPAKPQVMWLGSSQLVSQIDIRDIPVLSTHVQQVKSARDLGVFIDSQLSLSAHVTALCRSCYYHLQQLCPAAHSLSTETTITLVLAFTSCRLDSCNSLMYGVADSLSQERDDRNTSRRCYASCTGFQFINECGSKFNLACIMDKSLHRQAPSTWLMF